MESVRSADDDILRRLVSLLFDPGECDTYTGRTLIGRMQTVGDHAKALDGITAILTQAPLSPAAQRLRERAVFDG